MPKFSPLPYGFDIEAGITIVLNLALHEGTVTIDFIVPKNDEMILRARCGGTEVIRVLDEFALSTEKDTPETGRVANQLFYFVENAMFFESLAPVIRKRGVELRHFQFVTAGGCVDVLASEDPTFVLMKDPYG